MTNISRRSAICTLALLPAIAAVGMAKAQGTGSRSLVAFFTRTGNTRVVAGQIERATGSEIFEILPATPYPLDYEETVAQARRETAEGFLPELQATVSDIASFDTVYLGLPIWGTTAPPVIRSFLAAHDLGGKTIIPFITHGGYGVGSALDVLAEHAPETTFGEAFVIEADQERRSLEQVNGWLGSLPA